MGGAGKDRSAPREGKGRAVRTRFAKRVQLNTVIYLILKLSGGTKPGSEEASAVTPSHGLSWVASLISYVTGPPRGRTSVRYIGWLCSYQTLPLAAGLRVGSTGLQRMEGAQTSMYDLGITGSALEVITRKPCNHPLTLQEDSEPRGLLSCLTTTKVGQLGA